MLNPIKWIRDVFHTHQKYQDALHELRIEKGVSVGDVVCLHDGPEDVWVKVQSIETYRQPHTISCRPVDPPWYAKGGE